MFYQSHFYATNLSTTTKLVFIKQFSNVQIMNIVYFLKNILDLLTVWTYTLFMILQEIGEK